MLRKEIGSEFWDYSLTSNGNNVPSWLKWSGDILALLSGRTAIDLIIKDAEIDRKINTIYLPSYCCETMIEPFVRNGIKVLFYNIILNKEGSFECEFDRDLLVDAVIVMNYFGYSNSFFNDLVSHFSKKETLIIEDATQSLFNSFSVSSSVDYIFASLRKWYATPDGALLSKTKGKFDNSLTLLKSNTEYINNRREAFNLKLAYFNTLSGSKEVYFKKFNEASVILKESYVSYSMSDIGFKILNGLDVQTLQKSRRENANFLIKNLKGIDGISPIFNNVLENETPMFLPVIVKNDLRDKLRSFLINQQIYCPVHWPLSVHHEITDLAKEIYYNELSLVCDQRYNIADMQRIVEAVRTFFTQK